jgi:hypothetical protein
MEKRGLAEAGHGKAPVVIVMGYCLLSYDFGGLIPIADCAVNAIPQSYSQQKAL